MIASGRASSSITVRACDLIVCDVEECFVHRMHSYATIKGEISCCIRGRMNCFHTLHFLQLELAVIDGDIRSVGNDDLYYY